MDKHTPGPWFVNTAGGAKAGQPFKIDEFFVYAPNTQDDTAICADVIDPVTQEPSEANARLIAAAPDMLAALRRAVLALAFAAETSPAMRDDYKAVSAAIEKATGAKT